MNTKTKKYILLGLFYGLVLYDLVLIVAYIASLMPTTK